jgi:ribonuclease HII
MSVFEYRFTSKDGVDAFKVGALSGINMNNIAGLDEAGRGSVAGPVVVACVVLPETHGISDIKDSKALSPKKREKVAKIIKDNVLYGIGVRDNNYVDNVGIIEATHKAAEDAVKQLIKKTKVSVLLTDGGLKLAPYFDFPVYPIVKGDVWIESISAASILAKVYHDVIMSFYHDCWPVYDFSSNKGYGTPAHRKAVIKHGPCPIHRRSFRFFGETQGEQDG